MRRRDVIKLIAGSTAAWPLAVRAQQPAMPVIGFVSATSRDGYAAPQIAAFRQRLSESGFVEGQNVAIEFRWAEGRYDRLPALTAELVSRPDLDGLGGSAPWPLRSRGRVRGEQSFYVHGVSEGLPQRAMDVGDRGRGQGPAVPAAMVCPSGIVQVCLKLSVCTCGC